MTTATHTRTHHFLAAHELYPLLILKLLNNEPWGVVVHFTTSSATDATTKCLTSVSPSRRKVSLQAASRIIARKAPLEVRLHLALGRSRKNVAVTLWSVTF